MFLDYMEDVESEMSVINYKPNINTVIHSSMGTECLIVIITLIIADY